MNKIYLRLKKDKKGFFFLILFTFEKKMKSMVFQIHLISSGSQVERTWPNQPSATETQCTCKLPNYRRIKIEFRNTTKLIFYKNLLEKNKYYEKGLSMF